MNEKKITYIVLGVLVVGLVVMGMSSTTYALFSSDDYGTNTEAYATGLLYVEAKSKSDTISLTNALPISDEEGLESEPYVFTINNVGNLDYEFDVMLKSTGNASDTFPANLIKLQINNGEVTTLANLTDGKLNTDKITLLAGETIDYSIRIWLSEETSNEYINRSFNSKIVTNGQAIYTSSNNMSAVPSSNLSLGDYIYYTPGGAKFTPDSTKTNSTSNSEMDPSELNLWRVLSINDDGTVDIISEYATYKNVYFKGKVGYLNFVGYLNELASKYETDGITVGSRHFGYDGQTEFITDTSKITSTSAPWSSSTTNNNNEASGGGDTLYQTDYNLVYNVLGTRKANMPGTTTVTGYWMASRSYSYLGSTYWHFIVRNVSLSGSAGGRNLYSYNNRFSEVDYSSALRPIVTLDSELLYEAGTEDRYWSIKA